MILPRKGWFWLQWKESLFISLGWRKNENVWLVSVTDSLCLSQTVFFVTDSLCLSQIVCVCHRKFLSVSLCLYQAFFLIILGLTFTYSYMIFINICPWDFVLSGISIPTISSLWTTAGRPDFQSDWVRQTWLLKWPGQADLTFKVTWSGVPEFSKWLGL